MSMSITVNEESLNNNKTVSNEKILVVVDMQNDFIYGSLGNKETQNIVKPIVELINNFDGNILFTQDTHFDNYLLTQEGKNLPVVHCIRNTKGWEIIPEINIVDKLCFEKYNFGSTKLANWIYEEQKGLYDGLKEIVLCGVCTGICVIANAILLKTVLPEIKITVLKDYCACVTPESHKNALEVMKLLQINVE